MNYKEYEAWWRAQPADARLSNLGVTANAVYKNTPNLNIYLTPSQALALAGHMLRWAQEVLDHEVTDGVVHLYCLHEGGHRIEVGMNQAVRGGPGGDQAAD